MNPEIRAGTRMVKYIEKMVLLLFGMTGISGGLKQANYTGTMVLLLLGVII